jgi:hypothetical protein
MGKAIDHMHRPLTTMAAVSQTIDDRALFTLMVQGWIECRGDLELECDMEAESLSEAISEVSTYVVEGRRQRGAPMIKARELARADAKSKAYDRNRPKRKGSGLVRPAAHANRRPPLAAMGKKPSKPVYASKKSRTASKTSKIKPKGTSKARGSDSTATRTATEEARSAAVVGLPPAADSRAGRALARDETKRKAAADSQEGSTEQHARQELAQRARLDRRTQHKRTQEDTTADDTDATQEQGASQKSRLDRRTQRKRPQEGTDAEDAQAAQEQRAPQSARLDRRTQRKRPQEGTDNENTLPQGQRQRKDRLSQQKRAAEGEPSDEDENNTAREKSSNTKAATGTSEQEPD